MRLKSDSVGKKYRRAYWNKGQFYTVQHFGREIVIVKDEMGKEIIFTRDDLDRDWVYMGHE